MANDDKKPANLEDVLDQHEAENQATPPAASAQPAAPDNNPAPANTDTPRPAPEGGVVDDDAEEENAAKKSDKRAGEEAIKNSNEKTSLAETGKQAGNQRSGEPQRQVQDLSTYCVLDDIPPQKASALARMLKNDIRNISNKLDTAIKVATFPLRKSAKLGLASTHNQALTKFGDGLDKLLQKPTGLIAKGAKELYQGKDGNSGLKGGVKALLSKFDINPKPNKSIPPDQRRTLADPALNAAKTPVTAATDMAEKNAINNGPSRPGIQVK
ncbi:MAG: hypothetical protein DHS20C10_11140 [marine bacterium B5-7]|nr:MAG: hypothetical protein DHS20C10_11140 [marine bacterium B5-7]